jgi:CheY-like chemotaxis protein
MNSPERVILLVEDDPNDVFFLQYAFEGAGIRNPLHIVTDGQHAIDYLTGLGRYADRAGAPPPCLVLLDLKLPVVTGLHVLQWVRERPELHSLIVIVLTSSSEEKDILEAYRLGARSYLVKPVSLEQRLSLAQNLKSFWLELSRIPELSACPRPMPDVVGSTALSRD